MRSMSGVCARSYMTVICDQSYMINHIWLVICGAGTSHQNRHPGVSAPCCWNTTSLMIANLCLQPHISSYISIYMPDWLIYDLPYMITHIWFTIYGEQGFPVREDKHVFHIWFWRIWLFDIWFLYMTQVHTVYDLPNMIHRIWLNSLPYMIFRNMIFIYDSKSFRIWFFVYDFSYMIQNPSSYDFSYMIFRIW